LFIKSNSTRHNVCSELSRKVHVENLKNWHWIATKQALRHRKGTTQLGIKFKKNQTWTLLHIVIVILLMKLKPLQNQQFQVFNKSAMQM
jgi:hypothetical protein